METKCSSISSVSLFLKSYRGIIKPENIETTSLGVAYLAGLNAGLIKNVNAITKFWKKSKIVKPTTHKKTIKAEIKTWKKTIKNLISLNS